MRVSLLLLITMILPAVFLSCSKEDHLRSSGVITDTLRVSNNPGVCTYLIYEEIHLVLDGSMPGALSYHWEPSGESGPVISFLPNDYRRMEWIQNVGGDFLGAYDLEVTLPDTVITFTCVVSMKENMVYCPNAFTPNGDGRNDLWRVYFSSPSVRIEEMFIYNNDNRRVFHARGNEMMMWDGKYHEEQCPSGFYYYIVHYSLSSGTQRSTEGMLQLLGR